MIQVKARLSHAVLATALCVIVSSAVAGPVEDLSGVLKGRVGGSSEDRRSDVKVGPVKVGCKGDTLEANVQITGVSGSLEGDTAVMSVTYSGNYTRQGWDGPCQKVSSNLGGVENRSLSGTYTFRVTGKSVPKANDHLGHRLKLQGSCRARSRRQRHCHPRSAKRHCKRLLVTECIRRVRAEA